MGLWDQQPNIYNAVPRSVLLDIDIRDSDKARRDGVIKATLDATEEIAQKRKCGHTKELKFEYPVATSDEKVRLFEVLSVTCKCSVDFQLVQSPDAHWYTTYLCRSLRLSRLQLI